jgi:inner membrane protein
MPTIMTHALVPVIAGLALGHARITRPVLITGTILAMLPDADVVAFLIGIDYSDQFGHRGASHSLFVAGVIGILAAFALRPERFALVASFLFASMASHGVLDAFTNGGLGPALLWPVDHARHFAPITPIQVSPIGGDFFSMRGVYVLISEALWVWVPALLFALAARQFLGVRSAPHSLDLTKETL